jgi:hypothetical protein
MLDPRLSRSQETMLDTHSRLDTHSSLLFPRRDPLDTDSEDGPEPDSFWDTGSTRDPGLLSQLVL